MVAGHRTPVPDAFWHVPGMLSARRYVDGKGELPRYLTLYDVHDTDVFASQPCRALLDGPTEWSRSMRPSFQGFFRLACRPLARLGGGIGGALIVSTLTLEGAMPDETERRDTLSGALAIPAVTAAQLALVAPEVPAVPFAIGGALPNCPNDAVLALEGYDRGALEAALPDIKAWFKATALGRSPTVWTSYTLGYAIARQELQEVVTAVRPGLPTAVFGTQGNPQ